MCGWVRREQRAKGDVVAEFFETLEGALLLARILLAATFVITFLGPTGIRGVCTFLKLSGLSRYVASSFSAVRRVVQQMTDDIVEFGNVERARLAALMEQVEITLALDETFPPRHGVCLVGIEPVSNFIVAEEYAPTRDAVQWAATLGEATRNLKVTVGQVVSDEAAAIELFAQASGVKHRGPDVFHVQYEVTKTCSAPLAAKVRRADEASAKAAALHATRGAEKEKYRETHGRGEPDLTPDFDARIADAEARKRVAANALAEARTAQDAMSGVVRGIGAAYHPFDLATGDARSATTVEGALTVLLQRARTVVVEANLPERCAKAVEKAARVTGAMVATIAFVHRIAAERVSGLTCSDDVKELVRSVLIPAMYLARAACKAATAEESLQIAALARSLRERFDASAAWGNVDAIARQHILKIALGCADLFQRSTSCVEGRNGRLGLFQHGLHALHPQKLSALTVIHNYFTTRHDGMKWTTAAERFFGHAPSNLFEWLVERFDGPARPSATRPRKTRPGTVSGDVAAALASFHN